jgi:hypothetical protein
MIGPFGWLPPYDDAYITLTSAQALWSGSILNYPGTPALSGLTSPAHVLLIAVLLPVMAPLTALWVSQLAGTLLYGSGLWSLARSWALPPSQAVWVMVIGLTAGMVPHHLFNGLETGLALAAVTWAIALAVQRSAFAPVLFGILPFVRPEFVILAAALAAWCVYGSPRNQWLRTGALMTVGALPFVAFLFWQLGGIVPTSASTKAAFVADRCLPAQLKAAVTTAALLQWAFAIGPLALGLIGAWRAKIVQVCAVAYGVALLAYTWELPSHLLRYHHQRYLYGWFPIFLLGALALLHGRRKSLNLVLPIAAALGLVRLPAVWQSHREWNMAFHAEQHAIVEWLHGHVPARSRLMVIDAGFLAYATDYPLVDAVGLKTPASSDVHKRLTLPSCGTARGKALAVIAKTSAAEYFVSWGEWESSLRLAEQMSDEGAGAEEVRQRPLSVHMDWWYPVFRLSVP